MLTILSYTDPMDLWLAACEAPDPVPCPSTTGKNLPCTGKGQGGQSHCSKHFEKETGQKYKQPDFAKGALNNITVLYGDERLPVHVAVAYLKVGRELTDEEGIWFISGDATDFNPENIQIVPKKVLQDAQRQSHPPGEALRWSGDGTNAKYNPTSVRIPPKLLDFFEQEAVRTGSSRSAMIEHYLMEGVAKGTRPQSKDDQIAAAIAGGAA